MNEKKLDLPIQDEIMKDWDNLETPLVSICCTAYNHEPYIAQCLNGFLNQKTNFPFEIIVHDDASTDATAEIVRQYEAAYPKIIKPIYQTENQYSKKNDSVYRIINERVKGKYVAFCEGDDYWCKDSKLQRAVDFLEKNQEYSACAHNTFFNVMSKKKKDFVRYPNEDFDVDLHNVLKNNSYHFSSVVCKAEYWINKPDFCYKQSGVGDFPLAVYLSMIGKIKRFGDVMSVYRFGVPGSWQKRVARNYELKIRNAKNAIEMLKGANEWSRNNFKDEITNAILLRNYQILLWKGNFKEATNGLYKKFWENEPFMTKLKHILAYWINKITR